MSNVITPRVKSVENMVARARAITSRPATVQACHTCHVTLMNDWVLSHRTL